jgi:hypothetical protein
MAGRNPMVPRHRLLPSASAAGLSYLPQGNLLNPSVTGVSTPGKRRCFIFLILRIIKYQEGSLMIKNNAPAQTDTEPTILEQINDYYSRINA